MKYSHVMVGSSNIETSKKFYDAVFTAMGESAGTIDAKGRIVYGSEPPRFMVTRPINGKPVTFANGGTVSFILPSPEVIDAWHAAGLANGGTTAEDPPGLRVNGPRKFYQAYLRDPDGNKLGVNCVVSS